MNLKADINGHLYSLSLELKPADGPDESRRRHEVLIAAGQHALAAAKEFPNGEPSAPRKRAIFAAMMTYGRARLAGRLAEFHVERLSNGKFTSAPSWMIALVDKATQELLRSDWGKAPVREAGGHFVSHKGRYGDSQKQGTQRRFDTERKRIAAVQQVARRLAAPPEGGPRLLPEHEVSEQKARGWIRRYKKPSRVAEALLEDYLNEVARNQEKIVECYNGMVEQNRSQDAKKLRIVPTGKSPLKPNITRRWIKSISQRGREKLVHLERQSNGLKWRQVDYRNSQEQSLPNGPKGARTRDRQ